MPHAVSDPMVFNPMTVPGGRHRRGSAVALALLGLAGGLVLGGCSVPMADLPVIGLPAGAPARSAEPVAYPAVHDMPAARSEPVLDPDEQVKIENDLKLARERQTGATGGTTGQSSKAAADR